MASPTTSIPTGQSADDTSGSDGESATVALPAPSGGRFSAAIYEPFLWLGERRGMRQRRRRLLGRARGRTLEIGAGTGLNAAHYPDSLSELVLAEPVVEMADKIRRPQRPYPIRVVHASAELLPFADDSFDTVVSTMVLCTVADPELAIAEIERVLRPGGKLLFCEHVRSDSARLARWQDRLGDAWAAFAEGCRCDRDTLSALEARLEVAIDERGTWRGMAPLVHPLIVGEATGR